MILPLCVQLQRPTSLVPALDTLHACTLPAIQTQLAYRAVQSTTARHVRVAMRIPQHIGVCYFRHVFAALHCRVTIWHML